MKYSDLTWDKGPLGMFDTVHSTKIGDIELAVWRSGHFCWEIRGTNSPGEVKGSEFPRLIDAKKTAFKVFLAL